jgi:anti-anti-sigma factor
MSTIPARGCLLDVTIDFTTTHLFIRLTGEMDASTAGRVTTAVRQSPADGTHSAVLDLAELTFCDARGLAELVALHHQLSSTHAITVEGVRPQLQRILSITGVDRVLVPEQARGPARPLEALGSLPGGGAGPAET